MNDCNIKRKTREFIKGLLLCVPDLFITEMI